MAVEIKNVEFCGWKDCISVSDGTVEAIVTTAFGPRIMSLSAFGRENHLNVVKETAGKIFAPEEFAFYGGHRVWPAPERTDINYIGDNYRCDVTEEKNAVTVMTPVQKETGTKRGFRISVDDGKLTVKNIIENCSGRDIELSVWGITQFVGGGVLVLPTACPDTGLVANRAVSLWSYAFMGDSRFRWGNGLIAVTPHNRQVPPIKFGFTSALAKCVYFNHGQALVMESEPLKDGCYPDYGCNFECYSSAGLIEGEWLNPIGTLKSGEVGTLEVKFRIVDNIAKPDVKNETVTLELIERL